MRWRVALQQEHTGSVCQRGRRSRMLPSFNCRITRLGLRRDWVALRYSIRPAHLNLALVEDHDVWVVRAIQIWSTCGLYCCRVIVLAFRLFAGAIDAI